MTTTLDIDPARNWLARHVADSLWGRDYTSPATQTSVLLISGMPRALRPQVERAMELCLRSEAQPAPPGTDELTADWFTRWERDHSGTVRCRQALTATSPELDALEQVLGQLAARHHFEVEITGTD